MPDIPTTTVPYWIPAVTGFVGFALGWVSDWLKDMRAHSRDREARREARADSIIERRNQFQRETLLELQEAAQKLGRSCGEMNHADVMAFRAGGKWHKQVYPEDMNQRAFEANVEMTKLTIRVRDEQVRELAERLKVQCNSVLFSQSEQDAEEKMMVSMGTFGALNKGIGEVLRSLDDLDMQEQDSAK